MVELWVAEMAELSVLLMETLKVDMMVDLMAGHVDQ